MNTQVPLRSLFSGWGSTAENDWPALAKDGENWLRLHYRGHIDQETCKSLGYARMLWLATNGTSDDVYAAQSKYWVIEHRTRQRDALEAVKHSGMVRARDAYFGHDQGRNAYARAQARAHDAKLDQYLHEHVRENAHWLTPTAAVTQDELSTSQAPSLEDVAQHQEEKLLSKITGKVKKKPRGKPFSSEYQPRRKQND